jgi:hypothetical protein
MSQSFFHLVPDNDPLPELSSETFTYCNPDNCDAYTEEEHDAIMQESEGLSAALFAALDAYSEDHPELSYAVVLHAIDCLAYGVNRQMQEDTADA